MSREISLDRYEAESLVDLIEAHVPDDHLMMELARELRMKWGMSPREVK